MDVKQKTAQALEYVVAEARKFLRRDSKPNIKHEVVALLRNDDFQRAVEILENITPPAANIAAMYYLITASDEPLERKIKIPLENVGFYGGVGAGAGTMASLLMHLPPEIAYPIFLGMFLGAYGGRSIEWRMVQDYKDELDAGGRTAEVTEPAKQSWWKRSIGGRLADRYLGVSKDRGTEPGTDGKDDYGWSTLTKSGYYLTQAHVLAYMVISFVATYTLLR